MKSLIILLAVLSISSLLVRSELLMVVEVFRHGARGPLYENLDYSNWSAPGLLTAVGMRQHFLLGDALRTRYIKNQSFLSSSYNHTELYIRSTDVDRTIESAQAHLLGLYPFGTGPNLSYNYPAERAFPPYHNITFPVEELGNAALPHNYQPTPIHVVESENDFLLRGMDICPLWSRIKEEQSNTEFWANFTQEMAPTLRNLGRVLGLKKTPTINAAEDIIDTLYSDIYDNRPLPANFTEELWRNLTYLLEMKYQYVYLGNETQRRLLASPFLNNVNALFAQKLAGNNSQKYVMYSAHDSTVGPFMSALNFSSYRCVQKRFNELINPPSQNNQTNNTDNSSNETNSTNNTDGSNTSNETNSTNSSDSNNSNGTESNETNNSNSTSNETDSNTTDNDSSNSNSTNNETNDNSSNNASNSSDSSNETSNNTNENNNGSLNARRFLSKQLLKQEQPTVPVVPDNSSDNSSNSSTTSNETTDNNSTNNEENNTNSSNSTNSTNSTNETLPVEPVDYNCERGYPIFASDLLIELHRDANETYVMALYDGVYMNLCETNSTRCPFEEFSRRLRDYSFGDFKSSCQVAPQAEEEEIIEKTDAKKKESSKKSNESLKNYIVIIGSVEGVFILLLGGVMMARRNNWF